LRLFVALEIPAAVRENLAALVRELRPLAPEVRWARLENMHLTLKFIGEVPPPKADAIRAALVHVHAEERPLEMHFRGLGFFPDEKRPRVFWAGIEAGPGLPRLAAALENALEPLGVPREERAFTPHLTLARFHPPGTPEKLRAAVQKDSARDFGTFRAAEFHLIESHLKSSGAEYTRLASFPLAPAEA
jgi:2'-5' RNA ligase